MTSKRRNSAALIGVLVAAWASIGADCGGCPPIQLPKPMTDLRARELDPSITEGVGLSTTLISGDCRPMVMRQPSECGIDEHPRCFNARTSMRVLVVPTNISIPRSPACSDAFAVADLVPHAVADVRSSDGGEVAAAVVAGRYAVYVSKDDQCAICGLADAGAACLVDVPRGGIAARDLVFDEAAH
jgi:hypothetical protein